ncbi:MAG: AI-2E family transporter, partial [Thermoanaerobaculia bacterium]|nr:AI-2E family transporter [Thermoanaerobaculia bacterium]
MRRRSSGDGSAGGAVRGPKRARDEAAPRATALERTSVLNGVALWGLCLVSVFLTLRVARGLFMPIFAAVLLTILLAPVVRRLERVGIPRAVGAGLVLVGFMGLAGAATYQTAGPAQEWLARVPDNLRAIDSKLRLVREPVEKVAAAAEEVERMTTVVEAEPAAAVEVKEPTLLQSLLAGTQDLFAGLFVAVALLYFLLASGDLFLLKLVRALPAFEDRKRAVRIARRIEREVARHLTTVTLINLALGAAVGLGLHLAGMPNPLLWGAMAACLNFVPYLGALVGVVVVGAVALVTSEDLGRALLAPALYFALTLLEGSFLTPAILGRRLQINPVAVFLGLFVWGWLWGIPGALMAVPILTTVKATCDHVPGLAVVGELLGR